MREPSLVFDQVSVRLVLPKFEATRVLPSGHGWIKGSVGTSMNMTMSSPITNPGQGGHDLSSGIQEM